MKKCLGVVAFGLAAVMAANAGVPAANIQAGDKATTTKKSSAKKKHKAKKHNVTTAGAASTGKMEAPTHEDTPANPNGKKATSTKGTSAAKKANKHPSSGEPKADPQ